MGFNINSYLSLKSTRNVKRYTKQWNSVMHVNVKKTMGVVINGFSLGKISGSSKGTATDVQIFRNILLGGNLCVYLLNS